MSPTAATITATPSQFVGSTAKAMDASVRHATPVAPGTNDPG